MLDVLLFLIAPTLALTIRLDSLRLQGQHMSGLPAFTLISLVVYLAVFSLWHLSPLLAICQYRQFAPNRHSHPCWNGCPGSVVIVDSVNRVNPRPFSSFDQCYAGRGL